jgi:fibronectin-binding autotransporter adhesin
MQGFFIHVSDGSYPVTGTLGLNNSVRVTDLTHPFVKSEEKSPLSLIRLGATFADDPASTDPMVIYFDEKAQTGFDTYLDARKLMNTDYNVPNLYAFDTDGTKLSIDAMPETLDSLYSIPLGLKANIDGNIVFRIIDIEEDHPWDRIYLTDLVSGTENDLLNNKEYRVSLEAGEYKNRFLLNLMRKGTEPPDTSSNNDPFTVYNSRGIVKAYVNTDKTGSGLLSIYNLTGQVLINKRISAPGNYEFDHGFKNGIYIVSFVTKTYQNSRKIFIQNR